jgi:hypothetical protein
VKWDSFARVEPPGGTGSAGLPGEAAILGSLRETDVELAT